MNVRTGGDEKSDLASLAADIGVRIVNNVSIFPITVNSRFKTFQILFLNRGLFGVCRRISS